MDSRRKNYDDLLAVYDNINKHRPLEKHEQERAIYLSKRLKAQKREDRYRAANKEKRLEDRKKYAQTPKGKEIQKRANERAYQKFKEKRKKYSREWRLKNPEKYQEQLRRKAQAKTAKSPLTVIAAPTTVDAGTQPNQE